MATVDISDVYFTMNHIFCDYDEKPHIRKYSLLLEAMR